MKIDGTEGDSSDKKRLIPTRIRLAWAVLCGRSIAYRMNIAGSVWINRPKSQVIECTFGDPVKSIPDTAA